MSQKREKYPIGLQDFPGLISEGWVYVDKTRYVYELTEECKYVFLARPRRFGKSLFLSTVRAYFEGRRDLFKGLALDKLTDNWEAHPVLYLNLNTGEYSRPEGLEQTLQKQFAEMEDLYGRDESEQNYSQRFYGLIRRAHALTGKKVVILVDEYDKPLINTIDKPEIQECNRELLKAVYSNFKSLDGDIRFVMLTGVTRFSRLSVFSDLNNLRDISMNDRYAAICGITEAEMRVSMPMGIKAMANALQLSETKTIDELRQHYDGYHFTKCSEGLYNPFSLLTAFANSEIDDYWFATGTPTFLIKRLKKDDWRLPELEHAKSQPARLADIFADRDPIPLLFQTGYLTIKSYDTENKEYILDYPNIEVREGMIDALFGAYVDTGLRTDFDERKFRDDIRRGDIDGFMGRLVTMVANIPADHRFAREFEFQNIIYIIFMLLGQYVQTEVNVGGGRCDMVVLTKTDIYLLEFKYNRSVNEAMQQLVDHDYAAAYRQDGRDITLIAANYDAKTHALDWEAAARAK